VAACTPFCAGCHFHALAAGPPGGGWGGGEEGGGCGRAGVGPAGAAVHRADLKAVSSQYLEIHMRAGAGEGGGHPARRPELANTGAMTETESLIAEVRELRADVARLHAAHTAVHIRHGWMGLLLKDLSTNPYTQYKVHMWGAIYWLINFPLICCLFFFTPTLWIKLGIFITLIYSIYANLATDYGAMSAAEAAFGQPQPPPIPLEPPPPLTSM